MVCEGDDGSDEGDDGAWAAEAVRTRQIFLPTDRTAHPRGLLRMLSCPLSALLPSCYAIPMVTALGIQWLILGAHSMPGPAERALLPVLFRVYPLLCTVSSSHL